MSLFKEKKGAVPLLAGLSLGPIIALVVGVIVLIGLIFLFFSFNTFAVIGIVMIVLTLVFGLRGDFNRDKGIFMVVVIALGLIFVFSGQIGQSILSVDSIQTTVDGGKLVWTVFGSANNLDETYAFRQKFGKETLDDGTEITPQKYLSLTISEKSSTCNYGIIDLGSGIKGLSIPSKNIDLLVYDRNSGRNQILEGEKADQVIIDDPDGKGELVVSSEGLLGGANECPDYENVAIINQDGESKVVYKDALLQKRSYCSNPFSLLCIYSLFTETPENTQFTNSFDSYTISSSNFVGSGLDLGSATFTIRADQDYFDSVVFTPAPECKPRITDIRVDNEITEGASSTIEVDITNDEDNSCKITVTPSSSDASFSPTSRNPTLENDVTTTFTISNKAGEESNREIEIEACFFGFEGEICDTEIARYDSVKTGFGDTEPLPEPEPSEDEEKGCSWYQEPFTRVDKDYGPFYWRAYTPGFDPITTEVEDCKVADWVWIVSMMVVIISSVAIIVLSTKKRRKR